MNNDTLTDQEWEQFAELLEKIVNISEKNWREKSALVLEHVNNGDVHEFAGWFNDEE
jgi:hypothetical protein